MPTLINDKYLEGLKSNISAISHVTAILRTTLGPKGLDLMLVDDLGSSICTNDGVEIIDNIIIKHPIAKLLVEACKAQEHKVGDGTTSTAVLIDAILSNSFELISNHKYQVQKLITELRLANKEAKNFLHSSSKNFKDLEDPKIYDLVKIAARSEQDIATVVYKAFKMAPTALSRLPDLIFTALDIETKIESGFLIKKKSHFSYHLFKQNSQILLLEGAFEPDPLSSEVASTDEGVIRWERNLSQILSKAKEITESNIVGIFMTSSCLIQAEEIFAKAGILVLTHLKKSDLETLAYISNAKLLSRSSILQFDGKENLCGQIKSIQWRTDLNAFQIEGINKLCSIVIGAKTQTILEEKQRIAKDAAKALSTAFEGYVLGGGFAELATAKHLETFSSMAFQILAKSLKEIFVQILRNADLDSKDFLNYSKGIDLDSGLEIDFEACGVIDPLAVKISSLEIALELSIQILKIANIIQAKRV